MAISFAEFYRAVHGRPPFPWQERLASQVLAGVWPRTIGVPTGCGKTSVIDVAVFALAAQAGVPARERTAAMRIFFVVDRRLVVDDVSRHAEKLARAIDGAGSAELEWFREQLMRFGAPKPLETAVLRGGMYRSNRWADAPNQPLVCVSTVDQVGSRLLFRGYGVSDWRRPVDAGLVGNDSLMIVDEAHLSRPFLNTLGWVQRYQGEAWREEQTVAGLRFVKMSATAGELQGAFELDGEDLESEALKPRLEAEKIAELKEASDLAENAAEEAVRLADGGAGVVGVVLNTVAAARAAFDALESSGGDRILLTGRVRPYDRDLLLEASLDRMKAGRTRREGERLFVVATQTVEVGADLDFDALVTEAASLDALRQRFGRLDRLGGRRSTRAVILKPKRTKEKDWVYGEAGENTWKWLRAQGGASIDFGVLKMGELWARSDAENLNAVAEEGPLMFPAHVDAWAQTNPSPAADPAVAPFLHGAKALEAADVQIVWRADLESDDPSKWVEVLEAAPPISTEALPVPIWAAKRWLAGSTATMADVEGIPANEEGKEGDSERLFLIWRGPEKSDQGIRKLLPGDTIVMRASEGGCDQYGWNPNSTVKVRDIGDLCANQRTKTGGGKYRIRIHPMVLFPEDHEARQELSGLLDGVAMDDDDAVENLREYVVTKTAGNDDLHDAAKAVEWLRMRDYGAGGLFAESRWRRPRETGISEVDEADEDDYPSLTLPVRLSVHTDGVVKKTKEFVAACGMAGSAAAAAVKAAELHDEGKRDGRFQILLGNLDGEPLAKSEKCSRAEFSRRRRDSGYPKGARHEFASVALAAANPDWPEGNDRELALYLIGTHHGYGRPFPPVWTDDRDDAHEVARLGSGWADRYWALTRKYGWWGLAYLEAVLRRADCVRSREEEEGNT